MAYLPSGTCRQGHGRGGSGGCNRKHETPSGAAFERWAQDWPQFA